MCGIAGAVSWAPMDDTARRQVVALSRDIAHRGPDADGYYEDTNAALAHRRLSIIDIAGGRQPMQTEGGRYALTYNGEVYNFQNIRDELTRTGVVFKTRSDTETVLEALRYWGPAACKRFNGMFAFALWDKVDKILLLARDRYGQKPLYWSQQPDGTVYFSSEYAPLKTHVPVPGDLNEEAVELFLALGYIPDPYSFTKNIHKLLPGHFMRFSTAGITLKPYIDLAAMMGSRGGEGPAYRDLQHAVSRHQIADVPVGCFLSSGLDSALLARATPAPDELASFCLGSTDQAMDERSGARASADYIGTQHHDMEISPATPEIVDRLVDVYGEPFADPSGYAALALSDLARGHVKVALSGDGADELFAGYRRHAFHISEERYRRLLPQSVRAPLFNGLAKAYPKADSLPQFLRAKSTLLALALDSSAAYCESVSKVPQFDRKALYRREKADLATISYEHFRRLGEQCETENPWAQIQWLDLQTYLPGDILVKTDRASMRHGLEVRLPFLDIEFSAAAFTLDSQKLLSSGQGKQPLRRFAAGRLPSQVIEGKKRGFDIPIRQWLAEDLHQKVSLLPKSESLMDIGLLSTDGMTSVVQDHQTGRRNHTSLLWALIILERAITRQL